MKPIRLLSFLLIGGFFLISTSSCVVLHGKNSPQHLGWSKNSNNPHHRYSTNPGHQKSTIKVKTFSDSHPKDYRHGKK